MKSWLLTFSLIMMLLPCWSEATAAELPTITESSTIASGTSSPDLSELADNWQMISADQVSAEGASVSEEKFDVSRWYPVHHMPATVLQILEDDGVYKDLYNGMNLTTPGDLWKKDWWYRTVFSVPSGRQVYTLIFKGINYRAKIWVNGQKIADNTQAVGMYNTFEIDVSKLVHPGPQNVLALKITPERTITGEGTVELGDTWHDWLNWKYLGVFDPQKNVNFSFPPDRNAGVWKRVYLSSSGPVTIRHSYVATDLPLPETTPASLTVYADLSNHSEQPVSGKLSGEITRNGKEPIRFEQPVSLVRNATREITFSPQTFAALVVRNPDLWWPYRWGKPNLYHLELQFKINGEISDSQGIDFGIRKITQKRDTDNSFPEIGTGGNFYLQINGKDYLIRGAVYTPDVLFKNDPARDAAIMLYAKDMGLNMLRWELKIADDTMIERADREGMPVMLGWMCCGQWEHWNSWTAEDQSVARASLRARLRELRSHPAVVLWANGSDGLPPDPVLDDYHSIEKELHWQDAIVDTVSHVNRFWDGIHMAGPYVWHPPYYWFSEKFGPARGSSAEEGDNEIIPPLDSLKKFIPADKLWPINEYWYFHAGAIPDNNTLGDAVRVLEKRYGPSNSVEELSKKAQLAYYEDARAKYEAYGTHWSNRKMTMNWMMNNHWPSFFGHLFDYYYKQGGGYFGAKKALQALSVVWDYYATGDRSTAHVYAVNQSVEPLEHVSVTVRLYDLGGIQKYVSAAHDVTLAPSSSKDVLTIARIPGLTAVYFVQLQMNDAHGKLLAENVYWQSQTDDEIGPPSNDSQFSAKEVQWANMSDLNNMPAARVGVSGTCESANGESRVDIKLTNNSGHIAFFLRAEVTKENGEEILPIRYDDNYVTIFPHESRTIAARYDSLAGFKPSLRLQGYNLPQDLTAPISCGGAAP
jgi:exo-1,4-beta-D-glucosaminidase